MSKMDAGVPFEHDGVPYPGYVAGLCGHRVAQSEWRAGFRVCERCPDPAEPAVDDGCDCPVRPCPEMRGDPADTLVEHRSGCRLQPDEDIRNALADDLVRMGLMPEAGAR